MKAFPELKTERLLLRKPELTDCDRIFKLRSDPEVNKYIDRVPPTKVEDATSHIERINKNTDDGKSYYWAITLKGSTDLIGTVCLWNFSDDRKEAELGYEMMPAFHGKGYMNEALSAVIDFSFGELELQLVEAFTHHSNLPSLKLLAKNGFHLNPNKKDPDVPANVIYALQNTNWKSV